MPDIDPVVLPDQESALGCAGCGQCCSEIEVTFRPEDLKPPPWGDPFNLSFVRDHWHTEWAGTGKAGQGLAFRVTCDVYDDVHGRCLAYDERPGICRGYPRYGRPFEPGQHPDHEVRLRTPDGVTSCSYYLDVPGWADLGARPLIPLEVVKRQEPAGA